MILSGTAIGFICVAALLAAATLTAFLDRKERTKGNRTLSQIALGLFIAAFVGGVAVTLMKGIGPREEQGSPMRRPMAGSGPMDAIGTIDPAEFERLKKKVAKDPRDVKSRERLGHLYLQQQDFENVFRMAHEALQMNAQSAESRVHMAMVLAAMGEADQALAQFDQALKADPHNREALLFKKMVLSGVNELPGTKR